MSVKDHLVSIIDLAECRLRQPRVDANVRRDLEEIVRLAHTAIAEHEIAIVREGKLGSGKDHGGSGWDGDCG